MARMRGSVSDWPWRVAMNRLACPSMKGSMRERGAGRWQLRAYEGVDDVTGKSRYRTRSFKGNKRQAQSALAALVAEVEAGVVAPKAITVGELLEAWLTHIEHLRRSPTTLYGYRRLVLQLPAGFAG